MKRLSRAAVAAGCVILMLTAATCGPGVVWTGYHSFPGGKWMPGKNVTFAPDTINLQDSTKPAPQEGIWTLRYSADASVASFPMVVETESPEQGVYRCDTVNVKLLPGGRRTADNAKLGVFEITDTIRLGYGVRPGWTISFYPATVHPVEGILNITFTLK